MRIASITMIGQFPHGIDLHVRNLRWALTNEDHIFIITLPEFIKEFNLKNDNLTTYIPFKHKENNNFINFWKEFPNLIKKYNINPEWFMLMEQDIWFFAKPVIPTDIKTIISFLPRGSYRNVLMNNEILHSRVSECAQIIHRDIVYKAIDFGVEFSFAKETFVDKHKEKYQNISLSMNGKPDTMDEFSLYCALIEKTTVEHNVKASHLRGPESIHRLHPDVYNFATSERIKEVQKLTPYIDMYLVIAIYYIAGLWDKIDHLDWKKIEKESKKEIDRLLIVGNEWMTFQEYTRFDSLKVIVDNGFNYRDRYRSRS